MKKVAVVGMILVPKYLHPKIKRTSDNVEMTDRVKERVSSINNL